MIWENKDNKAYWYAMSSIQSGPAIRKLRLHTYVNIYKKKFT